MLILVVAIRALFLRGDPYETSDAVFGVKDSLIIDLESVDDATAKQYNVNPGMRLLKHDFFMVNEHQARELRDEKAREALAGLGRKLKLVNSLPVPDVD